MFAVIKTGGKQYIVKENDVLSVEKVPHKEGANFSISDVLLVGDKDIVVGTPSIKGASVEAKVLSQFRDKKVLVFRYRPKKRYKKMKGHRQHLTKIKITKISAK